MPGILSRTAGPGTVPGWSSLAKPCAVAARIPESDWLRSSVRWEFGPHLYFLPPLLRAALQDVQLHWPAGQFLQFGAEPVNLGMAMAVHQARSAGVESITGAEENRLTCQKRALC